MRSSKKKTDGAVQCAAHGMRNPYPYTEVSDGSIIEIVETLDAIFKELFKGCLSSDGDQKNQIWMPQAVAFALKEAFAAPPLLEGHGLCKDGTLRKNASETG